MSPCCLSSSSLSNSSRSQDVHFMRVNLISSFRSQDFNFHAKVKNRLIHTHTHGNNSPFSHIHSNVYSNSTSMQKQLCLNTEEGECCQRELKMAAESQNTGTEPSPADGGQACGWMAGFEGSSLLGWKWISERHNGSLRRVCGVVLKPCLRCPGC